MGSAGVTRGRGSAIASSPSLPFVRGTWHSALGPRPSALGTWHLALGTWHLALQLWACPSAALRAGLRAQQATIQLLPAAPSPLRRTARYCCAALLRVLGPPGAHPSRDGGTATATASGPRVRRGPSPPGPLSRTQASSRPESPRLYGRGGEPTFPPCHTRCLPEGLPHRHPPRTIPRWPEGSRPPARRWLGAAARTLARPSPTSPRGFWGRWASSASPVGAPPRSPPTPPLPHPPTAVLPPRGEPSITTKPRQRKTPPRSWGRGRRRAARNERRSRRGRGLPSRSGGRDSERVCRLLLRRLRGCGPPVSAGLRGWCRSPHPGRWCRA